MLSGEIALRNNHYYYYLLLISTYIIYTALGVALFHLLFTVWLMKCVMMFNLFIAVNLQDSCVFFNRKGCSCGRAPNGGLGCSITAVQG